MGRLKVAFPYLLFSAIAVGVALSNWQGEGTTERAAVDWDMPQSGNSDRVVHDPNVCPPCGMTVNAADALTGEIDGRTQRFCSEGCKEVHLSSRTASQSASTDLMSAVTDSRHSTRLVDPVCSMEVNAAWDFSHEHDGRTYHFCTAQCRDVFASDPNAYLGRRCSVCNTAVGEAGGLPATYLNNTYHLCSEEHRAAFKADPAAYFMHTMWGIPSWLYYTSIALVLIVSFGVFDWLSRHAGSTRTVATAAAVDRAPPSALPRERRSVPHGASGTHPTFTTFAAARSGAIGRDEARGDGERIASVADATGTESDASGVGSIATAAIAVKGRSTSTGHTAPGSMPTGSTPTAPNPTLSRMTASTSSPAVAPRSDRFDLMSIGLFRAAMMSRPFRFFWQAVFVVLFVVILAAGLFGNQNPALNIAPILTWTIWWAMLIVLIMFAGKAWCYVCPWDAIAGWTERLSFWKKKDEGLGLGLAWPRIIRNISIATIFFVGLTWVELGFGVTMKPRVTAYLGIAMLVMAIVSVFLFDRKSFCRYGCLVGRVSGLYAMFGGVEVRPRKGETCKGCHSKECVTGSDTAYGCPTFLYPGKLRTNTYCIQCMECVQACPHDNIAVNLRPWASDLAVEGKPRTDEAYLALLMLAITGFHGLTMTPAWGRLTGAIGGVADMGRILSFSLGMALLMLGPIAIYALLVAISMSLGRRHTLTPLRYRDYFIRYAYALLPIALFYHIAHNLEHLLMEGPKVAALMSDPFGWGWNIFGTAQWTIPPMISLDKLWLVQVLLVLVGHVYSLWVAQKTSLRLFGSAKAAFRSQLPMLAGMICFSVFSLWLLKQPMEMRTSAM